MFRYARMLASIMSVLAALPIGDLQQHYRQQAGAAANFLGVQAFATLATVLQTAQEREHNILTTLTSALEPSPMRPTSHLLELRR